VATLRAEILIFNQRDSEVENYPIVPEENLNMPYTDPQRKQEWEQQHRTQRLARRRELRRIERTRLETSGATRVPEVNNSALVWAPLVLGGALSAYDPKLAIGAGTLTLLVAALGKKGTGWWIVGAIVLVTGFFFYRNSQIEEEK
jgi:hypothetical protein